MEFSKFPQLGQSNFKYRNKSSVIIIISKRQKIATSNKTRAGRSVQNTLNLRSENKKNLLFIQRSET